MAETLPAINITDSNNARTLQRNIKNIEEFTHQKKIRKLKQGINYSIANHLEYLTKNWPQRDCQNYHTRRLYERGEEICKLCALHKNSTNKNCSEVQSTISQNLSYNEESSEESSTDHSIETTSIQGHKEKNRYHFDSTMVDTLEWILVLKVYAHQLNRDYTVKSPGKQPSPNLLVVSANQHADNVANQVKDVIDNIPVRYRQI
jgi:hypothetical protein